MDWKKQIRKLEPSKANLLKIFGAYNRALNTVGDDTYGLNWLYQASQDPLGGNDRWENFKRNISINISRHNNTNQQNRYHNSQNKTSDNRDDEIQRLKNRVNEVLEAYKEKMKSLEKEIQAHKNTRFRLHEVEKQYNELKKTQSTINFHQTMLKNLLRLCHPDKHSGRLQELASDCTRWLLDQKK